MASLRMTLLDLLNKSEQGADPNFLRDGVRLLTQEPMDAEVTNLVGAEPHQRSAGRTTYRNGYRDRLFEKRYPQLVKIVQEAEVDVLAYVSYPVEHRRQIWSTNSLERLNKEVSRRCDWSASFPIVHRYCG
jgi:transposase-like protein